MRGRFLRLVRFYVKQRYSRYFLLVYIMIFLAAGLPSALLSPRPTPAMESALVLDASVLVVAISAPALLLSSFGSLLRAEVDVVMTTQADPVEFIASKVAGDSLIYLVMLAAYTAPYALRFAHGPAAPAEYAISLLAAAAIVSLLGGAAYPMGFRARIASAAALAAYLLATAALAPRLNLLYGLIAPGPLYAAILVALAALLFAAFPRRAALELYTNAYGLLIPPWQGRRPSARPIESRMPRTRWGVIWYTSTRSAAFWASFGGPSARSYSVRRANVLKFAFPASAALAASSALLIRLAAAPPALLVLLSSFGLFYAISVGMSTTLPTERLWINFLGDAAEYVRYRMVARAALAYLILAPWVALYAALWSAGCAAAAIAITSAASAPLLLAPLGWILGAYWGMPQVAEPGISQRPAAFSLRYMASGFLVMVMAVVVLAPVALAVAAESATVQAARALLTASTAYSLALLIASASFFAASLLTGWGRGVWCWIRDRLLEQGYV